MHGFTVALFWYPTSSAKPAKKRHMHRMSSVYLSRFMSFRGHHSMSEGGAGSFERDICLHIGQSDSPGSCTGSIIFPASLKTGGKGPIASTDMVCLSRLGLTHSVPQVCNTVCAEKIPVMISASPNQPAIYSQLQSSLRSRAEKNVRRTERQRHIATNSVRSS